MKFTQKLFNKGILCLLFLLAPMGAVADGHNMDGLVLYFFIIAALLFIPLVVLTIIAGVYYSRPKKKTLQLYAVLSILVIVFYLTIGLANLEMIEDLANYIYVPILLFTFMAVINATLIVSGYSSRDKSADDPEQNGQKMSVGPGSMDQRIFTYLLVCFFLHFITTGINYYYPDWYGTGLRFFVFFLYFLNSMAFILLLMVIENRNLKLIASALWLAYLIIQVAEYSKFLRANLDF